MRSAWAAALLALLLSACVSGGGESAGAAVVGGVLLASPVVKSAQEGEKGARRLWCGTLKLTEARLDAAGSATSDDDLVEALTPDVYQAARESGYALHRQQIGELVRDALKVARDPDARTKATDDCGKA